MEQIRPGHPSRLARSGTAQLAVEDHGRALTTMVPAAAWYRQAQRAVDHRVATSALRLALTADPAFELAIADLHALTDTHTGRISGRPMTWERHHIEVVSAAAAGDVARAADLLREHLASVGCDPLALRIVVLRRPPGDWTGLEDLTSHLPGCHAPWR